MIFSHHILIKNFPDLNKQLRFLYISYMKTMLTQNDHGAGYKKELSGGGAGCVSILMMPEGIIAVGLTGDDSTGIGAKSGGADGTAPMVLTRMRQCHPGPAGIGWRGKAPRRRCKTKFCYTSFTAEVPGAANFETVRLRRSQDRSSERFQNAHGNAAEREGDAAASCSRGRPQCPSVWPQNDRHSCELCGS